MSHPEIKLHIFDVDGTLLDSMPMWENLGGDYLTRRGIPHPDNLLEEIYAQTLPETAAWFHELGIPEDAAFIEGEIISMAEEAYRERLLLFPGTKENLLKLSQGDAPLVILSTSSEKLIRQAFSRLGILEYFQGIYTPENMGMGKDKPEIFRRVCEYWDVSPKNSMVYDDSDYALEAAKEAGCQITPCSTEGWVSIIK